MNAEEQIAAIRGWLRYHGDYDVEVRLWGLYGCMDFRVMHRNHILKVFTGRTLEKQLGKVLAYLQALEK